MHHMRHLWPDLSSLFIRHLFVLALYCLMLQLHMCLMTPEAALC